VPYVAAKAGAAQLVRQAALELARYNITVNAIAPGPFVTNISGGRLRDPAVRAPFEKFSRCGGSASLMTSKGSRCSWPLPRPRSSRGLKS
jgi:NAD(P)-dependent dehydrogenase (short-subunit alcohol dehydrogenase family)